MPSGRRTMQRSSHRLRRHRNDVWPSSPRSVLGVVPTAPRRRRSAPGGPRPRGRSSELDPAIRTAIARTTEHGTGIVAHPGDGSYAGGPDRRDAALVDPAIRRSTPRSPPAPSADAGRRRAPATDDGFAWGAAALGLARRHRRHVPRARVCHARAARMDGFAAPEREGGIRVRSAHPDSPSSRASATSDSSR